MKTLLTLRAYTKLSRKIIYALANKYGKNTVTEMLKDDDAIGNLAYSLMLADWKWDGDHQGEHGPSNLFSFRKQKAVWAIQNFVRDKAKSRYVSLNTLCDNEETEFCDTKSLPTDNLHEIVATYCSSQEATYIELYYWQGYTLREIALQHGLRCHGVVQRSITTALRKLKKAYKRM